MIRRILYAAVHYALALVAGGCLIALFWGVL